MSMSVTENAQKAGRSLRPAPSPREIPEKVKVWDIAVRLFHWSLVISYAIAWASADEWDRLHEMAGYMIAALVGFRLIWGIIGTRHARFLDFVYSPSTVLAYLRDSLAGRAKRYLGHNPAGGAMIIAMLIFLTAATASGIAMTTSAFWGVEWVEEAHEAIATFTLLLVGFHLAGVVFSSITHHENLVSAMITGYKKSAK